MNRFLWSVVFGVTFAGLPACTSVTPRNHGDVVVGERAIFRHKASKMAKLDCTECHDKLYTNVSQHQKSDMDQIFFSGESCGTCHNGTRAFSTRGNCKMCHRK